MTQSNPANWLSLVVGPLLSNPSQTKVTVHTCLIRHCTLIKFTLQCLPSLPEVAQL